MSQRIGTAIRCEEQRVHYLKNEYDKLLTFIQPHEIAASDSCKVLKRSFSRISHVMVV